MNSTTGGNTATGELENLLSGRRSVRSYTQEEVSLRAIRRILAAAQRITSVDGKRTAPSAHALHPLALFLVAVRVEGLERGMYAYAVDEGRLHKVGDTPAHGALLSASLAGDSFLEEAPAVVVVAARIDTAIRHFAEQQPDGKRGVRYVDFEAGACTQNMYLAVTAEALGAVVVMGFDDDRMKTVLKLPADLAPIALFCVGHAQT
ncbi:nitroreductase family protein [Paraburkholderia flava]|uniref:nitroreductase family protein n=1 Tax=Paraburkholderia flava TaxID=2547393 RepID=UPI00105CE44A|nr:SagB/ThcOx family dehydrogenase [Paraburkholderia flava]